MSTTIFLEAKTPLAGNLHFTANEHADFRKQSLWNPHICHETQRSILVRPEISKKRASNVLDRFPAWLLAVGRGNLISNVCGKGLNCFGGENVQLCGENMEVKSCCWRGNEIPIFFVTLYFITEDLRPPWVGLRPSGPRKRNNNLADMKYPIGCWVVCLHRNTLQLTLSADF